MAHCYILSHGPSYNIKSIKPVKKIYQNLLKIFENVPLQCEARIIILEGGWSGGVGWHAYFNLREGGRMTYFNMAGVGG